MNGQDFSRVIDGAFVPFMKELHFRMQPVSISGRAYRSNFVGEKYTLIVSFEPGDEYFSIMLLTNGADDLESIDDRAMTPRLSDLNTQYMGQITPAERDANDAFFADIIVTHPLEKKLLKFAKDLRLVLPKYLAG